MIMATSTGRKANTDEAAEKATEEKPVETNEDSGTDYLNVSGGPLVFDKDGHQVDADAWTGPINLDAVGRAARANDFLLPRSAL
jgi:hypothetical protein